MSDNLFANLPAVGAADEQFTTLLAERELEVRRIVSTGQASPRDSGTNSRRPSGYCWSVAKRCSASKMNPSRVACFPAVTSISRRGIGTGLTGRRRIARPSG